MVNVIDLIAEMNSKARYRTNKGEAWEYFKKQKSALESISETQGFQEIREYRAREVVASQWRLQTIKWEDIKWVQAELKISMRFLDFLDNILNTPLSDKDF